MVFRSPGAGLALCLLFSLGCVSKSGGGHGELVEDAAAASFDCSSSCERNDWPRLILGIVGGLEGGLTVDAVDSGGRVSLSTPRGCPFATNYVCSHSWTPGPNTDLLTIRVRGEGVEMMWDVRLGEHNYCGRDIAYVELRIDKSPWVASRVRLLSPCSQP